MTIEVRLSENQYRHFLIFNILKRLKLYRNPVISGAILIAASIIAFLMHTVEGAVFLGSVLLVIGLGMPAIYFAIFFSSVKRQVELQKLNPPRLVYTLQFDENSDSLGVSNEKEQASYRWQDIYHAYYDTTSIYLFITKERAFLLPLALLDNKDETWNLIVSKLGDKKCTNMV